MQFQGCNIKQNKAQQYGGGARIHTRLRDQQTRSTGIVSFSNCSFEQNEAYYAWVSGIRRLFSLAAY